MKKNPKSKVAQNLPELPRIHVSGVGSCHGWTNRQTDRHTHTHTHTQMDRQPRNHVSRGGVGGGILPWTDRPLTDRRHHTVTGRVAPCEQQGATKNPILSFFGLRVPPLATKKGLVLRVIDCDLLQISPIRPSTHFSGQVLGYI